MKHTHLTNLLDKKRELITRLMVCSKRIEFMTVPDGSNIVASTHHALRYINESSLVPDQYKYAKNLVKNIESVQLYSLSEYSGRMIRLGLILVY